MLITAHIACVKNPAVADGPGGDTLSEERILTLSAANFDSAIAGDYRLAMIDFFSPTCHSCMALAPVVDSLARTLPAGVLIGKVDITVDTALSNTYKIQLLPTVIFIRGGAEALRVIGARTVEYFTGIVDSLLQLP